VASSLLKELTGGQWPLGWYTGRDSPNTRRLVVDQGGYEYDSDYYGDDLPFWLQVKKTDGSLAPHLVVPYSLDTNDMRFVQAQGFNTGDHFFTYLRDAFDALYAEGDPDGLDRPKMMSIGMHCRLLGKPGRIGSLQRFLDHIQSRPRVDPRRIDIARHWKQVHPFDPPPRSSGSEHAQPGPDQRRHAGRVRRLLDGTYEHSPWIASRPGRSGPSRRWRR
jgi:allantoinase